MLKVLFLMLLISSCGSLDPYIDRRRNPGTSDVSKLYTGTSKPDAPSVCYNPFLSEENEIQVLADAECSKHNQGTHAVFVEKKNFGCKVLLPVVNFYQCEK